MQAFSSMFIAPSSVKCAQNNTLARESNESLEWIPICHGVLTQAVIFCCVQQPPSSSYTAPKETEFLDYVILIVPVIQNHL